MKRSPQSAQHAAVAAELEQVVASPVFGGSARQIRLLRFRGRRGPRGARRRSARTLLATRVFDRPEGFDSVEDSIVRVEMSKLRRALERYCAASPAAAGAHRAATRPLCPRLPPWGRPRPTPPSPAPPRAPRWIAAR